MKKEISIQITAAIFILLFTYTAISKLTEVSTLQHVLKNYPLVGAVAPAIAWGLPFIELLVATLLFLPNTRSTGLCAALILMGIFTLYVAYMLLFTDHNYCTCGGILQKLSWPEHLIFNILLTTLAIVGVSRLKNDPFPKNNIQQETRILGS